MATCPTWRKPGFTTNPTRRNWSENAPLTQWRLGGGADEMNKGQVLVARNQSPCFEAGLSVGFSWRWNAFFNSGFAPTAFQ